MESCVILMAKATKTIEERVAEFDVKIAKKKEELAKLESQKEALLKPVNWRTVMAAAKENGLSAKEVADRLGLVIE